MRIIPGRRGERGKGINLTLLEWKKQNKTIPIFRTILGYVSQLALLCTYHVCYEGGAYKV